MQFALSEPALALNYVISRGPFKPFCVSVIYGVRSSVCLQQLGLCTADPSIWTFRYNDTKFVLCSVMCRCAKDINLNHGEQKWVIFIKENINIEKNVNL